MKVCITFGQIHVHSVNGKTFDKDCVAVIECEDYTDGRNKAFEYFDDKFHMCYGKDWKVETNYHLLFADDNTSAGGTNGLSKRGNYRGQLLRNEINYSVNKHISHRVETELFLPGNFYSRERNDVAVLFRYGILLTW